MTSAVRQGSSDTAIRDAEHADLPALVARLPRLRAIGFNGGKPAKIGRQQLGTCSTEPVLIDLPSSSSAYAAMLFEEKLARWQVLAGYLA